MVVIPSWKGILHSGLWKQSVVRDHQTIKRISSYKITSSPEIIGEPYRLLDGFCDLENNPFVEVCFIFKTKMAIIPYTYVNVDEIITILEHYISYQRTCSYIVFIHLPVFSLSKCLLAYVSKAISISFLFLEDRLKGFDDFKNKQQKMHEVMFFDMLLNILRLI